MSLHMAEKNRMRVKMADLQQEVDELRDEAEATQTLVAKLYGKLDETEDIRKENAMIKDQFLEVREDFKTVATELKTLRELEKTWIGPVGRARNGKRASVPKKREKSCTSCSKLQFERNQALKKNTHLAQANKLLNNSCRSLETQTRVYQKEFLESLGIPESQLCGNVPTGDHSPDFDGTDLKKLKECECNHLHKFLRRAMENLRSEYHAQSELVSDLKAELQKEKLKCQNFQVEINAHVEERKRAIEGFKKHEVQITYLTNEIKELQNYCSRQLQKDMEGRIQALKKDNQELETEIMEMSRAHGKRISILENNLRMECQRSDELMAQGIQEREVIEKRWKQIWDEQHTTLTEQLDTMKANYEHPLKTSHSRELTLQQELVDLQDRYKKSKNAWEKYRNTLFEQLNEWKFRYSEKCNVLDDVRHSKTELDMVHSKKIEALERCQLMLKKGVEERQLLQKKVEATQAKLRELLTPARLTEDGMADALSPVIALNDLTLLGPSRSWFTLRDFKNLKDKMFTELNEGVVPSSAVSCSSPRYQKTKSLPKRPMTTSLGDFLSRELVFTPKKEEDSDPFAFTIGKGRESAKKVSKSKPSTPVTPRPRKASRLNSGKTTPKRTQPRSGSSTSTKT